MDVIELQNKIILEPQLIETVLSHLGHEDIRDRVTYYQTSNLDGDNKTAISIRKEDLVYSNFTRGDKGNLFTLVMSEKSCDFPKALQYIAKWIGFKSSVIIKKPFDGFYEKLIHSESQPELHMKTYKEVDLPAPDNLSLKWLKDGVSLQVQEKYGIRYDHVTNGIIVPARNYNGEIIGAKWRNNDNNCKSDERWNMYIPYQKSYILWGFNEHYKHIQNKGTAIVVEAEKSVLQAESFDCNLCLGIGGHNLSNTQIKYLRGLMCKRIIVAFDEGLCEEEINYEANKLKNKKDLMGLFNTKIGYIYDSEHKYLKEGSKNSPTDLGRDIFQSLCKECVVWI